MRNVNLLTPIFLGIALPLFIVACGREQAAVAPPQAATASEPKCKVHDTDLAASYSGDCRNGLAHGDGTARGRDSYQGQFVNGHLHGKGVYAWGADTQWRTQVYDGWSFKGYRAGYGVLRGSTGQDNPRLDFFKEKGVLEDGQYVIRAIWAGPDQFMSCPSKDACLRNIPELGFKKALDKLVRVPDKLFTFNGIVYQMQQKARTAGSERERCIVASLVGELIEENRGGNVLDAKEVLKLLAWLEDKERLAAIASYCIVLGSEGKAVEQAEIDRYQDIGLDQLAVDIQQLSGERVRVRGLGLQMANHLVVRRDATDTNLIFVNQAKLSRTEKLEVIRKCSTSVLEGCSLTISGLIQKGALDPSPEILAEEVQIQ